MMTVTRHTTLPAPAPLVWRAVLRPESFVHVTSGVLRYPPAERHDGPWRSGDDLTGWVLLGGVLPGTRHRLRIVEVDHAARRLRSDEGGGFVRAWRHVITVDPVDDRTCRYGDLVEIDAGPLTPLVAAFARLLYAHRQRRWRRLATLLAAACHRRGAGATAGTGERA